MRKLIWTLVIVAIIAVFGGRAWYLYRQSEQNKDAIKIGVVVPLSGFDENMTDRIITTLKTATEELTKKKPYKIQYLFEDGKYTVKDSISAFNKLKASNPSAYVVLGDLPAFGLRPLINETKVPTIVLVSGDSGLPAQSPYLFRMSLSSKDMIQKLASFTYNTKHISDAAIMKIKNNYGDDGSQFFKQYFAQLGGKVIAEETFNVMDMDVRAQVEKVLATNPNMILVWGFGPGYTTTFNQLAELGYKGEIITDFGVFDKAVWENIHNKGDGIYFTTIDSQVNKMNPQFLQNYTAKFSDKPDVVTSFAYAAVEALLKAIENPKGIEAGLYELQNFETAIGKVNYDKEGEPHAPIVIKQMQSDGTAKVIKE